MTFKANKIHEYSLSLLSPLIPAACAFFFFKFRNLRRPRLRLGGPVCPECMRVPAVLQRGSVGGVWQRRHHVQQRVRAANVLLHAEEENWCGEARQLRRRWGKMDWENGAIMLTNWPLEMVQLSLSSDLCYTSHSSVDCRNGHTCCQRRASRLTRRGNTRWKSHSALVTKTCFTETTGYWVIEFRPILLEQSFNGLAVSTLLLLHLFFFFSHCKIIRYIPSWVVFFL